MARMRGNQMSLDGEGEFFMLTPEERLIEMIKGFTCCRRYPVFFWGYARNPDDVNNIITYPLTSLNGSNL